MRRSQQLDGVYYACRQLTTFPMRAKAYAHIFAVFLLAGLLVACDRQERQYSLLEQVQRDGVLRVATRNAATTYYEGAEGPAGLEYELAKNFADELGVNLKVIVAGNVTEVLTRLASGEAHVAAAGLTITKERQANIRFTPPYQTITPQLIYRMDRRRPRDLTQVTDLIEVTAASSHAERLRKFKAKYPNLTWTENMELDSEELLSLVWERQIPYTIVDSNEMRLNQRYYPELRVAFGLGDPEQLAWAFPPSQDTSLFDAASRYFNRIKQSGALARILERHYGHLDKEFDYVGTRIFMRHVEQRLPHYRMLFEAAGRANELDWRLLAAMAYQESHWDTNAVSPTGVRGLMMLTKATADFIGVDNRTDPLQSVEGGSRYLRRLIGKIPERIKEPDRLWLALASYNIGFGHLEDGRVLTEMRGGNPDSWKDVKENLPLLRKRVWHKKTKYGYARGNEAVQYVENIRSYYDLLVWLTEREESPKTTTTDNVREASSN